MLRIKKFITAYQLIIAILIILCILSLHLMISLLSFYPFDQSWLQTSDNAFTYNLGSRIGAWFADTLFFIFGRIAYILPISIIILCSNIFVQLKKYNYINFWNLSFHLIGNYILLIASCGLVELNIDDLQYFSSGGIIGYFIRNFLLSEFNDINCTLILLCIWGLGLILFIGWPWWIITEKISLFIFKYTTFLFNLFKCKNDSYFRAITTNNETKKNFSLYGKKIEPRINLSLSILRNKDFALSLQLIDVINNMHYSMPFNPIITLNDDLSNGLVNCSNNKSKQKLLNNNYFLVGKKRKYSNIYFGVGFTTTESSKISQEFYNRFELPCISVMQKIFSTEKKCFCIDDYQMNVFHRNSTYNFIHKEQHKCILTVSFIPIKQELTLLNFIPAISSLSINKWNSNKTEQQSNKKSHLQKNNSKKKIQINDINSNDKLINSHKDYCRNKNATISAAVGDINNSCKRDRVLVEKQEFHFNAHSISQKKFSKQKTSIQAPTINSLNNPLYKYQEHILQKQKILLPNVNLLINPSNKEKQVDMFAMKEMARMIEIKLSEYRIKANVVSIFPGPVVTRFELNLAPGIKASSISSLAQDLARSLSVISVRIINVIPNKPYVGLELPNKCRQIIYLREVLDCDKFYKMSSPLTLLLGKDISGQPVIADLSKMPHLLIAGTTGSGKSVGINAMILSILYKATPKDVRFIMIDPKILELSVYEGIPHLLTKVVTDVKDAANALNWCIHEMEQRYKLMSMVGVRNLISYNQYVQQQKNIKKSVTNPLKSLDTETAKVMATLEMLPYIVVIVDEFSDLIMTVGKKIEELIVRIVQKARAAGIHLILATQRPSVNVITGLIKANIPTRIAFRVSNKIDSRTILDQTGAESLLGMGDMLYLASNSCSPLRIHGAFIHDEEVHAVVNYLKSKNQSQRNEDYIEIK